MVCEPLFGSTLCLANGGGGPALPPPYQGCGPCQDKQATAPGKLLPTTCFYIGCELRIGFTFLIVFNNQEKNVSWHVKMIWNPNFSARVLFDWKPATRTPVCCAWLLPHSDSRVSSCNGLSSLGGRIYLLSGSSRKGLPALLQMDRRKGRAEHSHAGCTVESPIELPEQANGRASPSIF